MMEWIPIGPFLQSLPSTAKMITFIGSLQFVYRALDKMMALIADETSERSLGPGYIEALH